MSQSPSSIVYDFTVEIVAAAAEDSILEDAETLDSAYQLIKKSKGIVVSNSEFALAPKQESDILAFDALLIVGFYYRIKGTKTEERKLARDKCFEMAEAFAEAVYADMSLNDRVCDCLLLRAVDGTDNTTGDTFAIINQPIVLNPSGAPIDYTLGEAK